jgi:hypothetical protein
MARNWMESVCVVLNGTKADKKEEEGVELARRQQAPSSQHGSFLTAITISM